MTLSLGTTLMLVKISYTQKAFETALAGKDKGGTLSARCFHNVFACSMARWDHERHPAL